jgi:succinylarginine dihydrolase
MNAQEWQFDGLVGPTHNYAGLAMGNLAAATNAGSVSNPRLAALQGLEKMKFVSGLGVKQAFLPPHYRPLIGVLKQLGFSGDLGTILDNAARIAPGLLASVYSSAFMWTANAATVTPSVDSWDGRLHLTPANLSSHFHRSLEPAFSKRVLTSIFRNQKLFSVHNALPMVDIFGDEGAANHMKICSNHFDIGEDIFVYGKSHDMTFSTSKFSPRQHRTASEAIARLHGLQPERTHFYQQSPEAIDLGVFHNDVIALNTASRMIIHEKALIPEHQAALRQRFLNHSEWQLIEITSEELSIQDAVSTYLFNSQLLFLEGNKFALVAPSECSNHAGVSAVVSRLIDRGVLDAVHYLDVRESMRNGGGPACLRLRIVMTPEQSDAMHQEVVYSADMHNRLSGWVKTHYRDRLCFADLKDPQLANELERAYSELEVILNLPGLYDPWRMNGGKQT